MNGTTSRPKSVLRYVVDKVKLIVPNWGVLLQCEFSEFPDPEADALQIKQSLPVLSYLNLVFGNLDFIAFVACSHFDLEK